MFRQIMMAVVDTLLAIPPVRFVMGLVEPRWRPLWATLWLAAIAYIVSRTMNQLTLHRARRQLLRESAERGQTKPDSEPSAQEPPTDATVPEDVAAPDASSEPEKGRLTLRRVPLPFIAVAVGVGVLAVALTSVAMRDDRKRPADSAIAQAEATAAPADSALDVRWRSGRMADDDCIGTFEVTRGPGTRASFVAFVMDTSGAVMARDSTRVASTVRGLLVEFRFRHVDCDEIDDWQLQATTPRRR